MSVLLWIPLLLPLATAAAAWWRRDHAWTRPADLVVAAVVLGTGLALIAAVAAQGPLVAAGGLLRADALSAWLLTTIGAVAVTALWGGLPERSAPQGPPDGRYTALICLFLAAMSLAVLADNLGVLWVAIEATTIATAFLVGHHRTQRSLEAAWKYVVLGSVGVAIAFLGIVLLYAATVAAGEPTLSWAALADGGIPLDPDLTRIAVALAVLGFATKAGLAPMHSWLPDAHSQAPAPVSGLMSGVLLSVALYAILRIQAISTQCHRARLPARPAGGRRAAVAGGRGGADPRAARLQADAGLLQHRAHGDHGPGRGGRRPAGHRRGAAAHARATAW